MGTYQEDSFRGVMNTQLKLITCKYKFAIPLILQSYVLCWYHMYLLYPVMDRPEAMIHQHLYHPGIIKTVWKEVPNCETCQRKKQPNIKDGTYQLRNLRE